MERTNLQKAFFYKLWFFDTLVIVFVFFMLPCAVRGSDLKPEEINYSFNAVDFTICIGATKTLTPSGAAGGTWTINATTYATVSQSGVVTGVASGSATVTYTVSGASETFSIIVSANTAPTVTETHVNDPCQTGVGSITITLSGGTPTYTINACAQINSPATGTASITPTTTTTSGSTLTYNNLLGNATYTFLITDTNGCVAKQ